MTAELQRVSNGPDQVLIEEAYMAGYLEAVEHEKRRKQAIKEKREKKKYFLTQKLYGVAILIFTAVAVKILNGDATIALLTVADLKRIGVHPSYLEELEDPLIVEAALVYTKANFGNPENHNELMASYDMICTKIKGGGYHRSRS